MGRGIERRRVVPDDTDRADVSGRLAALGTATALTVYAWALLPHHDLRVQTGGRPLAYSLVCGPLGVSGYNVPLDVLHRHRVPREGSLPLG